MRLITTGFRKIQEIPRIDCSPPRIVSKAQTGGLMEEGKARLHDGQDYSGEEEKNYKGESLVIEGSFRIQSQHRVV